MNAETIAALERAEKLLEHQAHEWQGWQSKDAQDDRDAAALIRALIERERNGGERQDAFRAAREHVLMMKAGVTFAPETHAEFIKGHGVGMEGAAWAVLELANHEFRASGAHLNGEAS